MTVRHANQSMSSGDYNLYQDTERPLRLHFHHIGLLIKLGLKGCLAASHVQTCLDVYHVVVPMHWLPSTNDTEASYMPPPPQLLGNNVGCHRVCWSLCGQIPPNTRNYAPHCRRGVMASCTHYFLRPCCLRYHNELIVE